MAKLRLLVAALCSASAFASPWDRHQKRGKDETPKGYGDDSPAFLVGPNGHSSSPDAPQGPPAYDHSPSKWSAEIPKSTPSYGKPASSWAPEVPHSVPEYGHSSSCAAVTVTEVSYATISGSQQIVTKHQKASTLTVTDCKEGPVTTATITALATITQKGSVYTTTVEKNNVHTSYIVKNHTVQGPTQYSTAYSTVQGPTRYATEYSTIHGPTKVSVAYATDVEYSTVYNTKTATATSVITAPGK